jgi:uncharacterized repeat protein (TIGR03803 family)
VRKWRRSGWTENVLYIFGGFEGNRNPNSGLIFDSLGNLYGTTYVGGAGSGGTVFELTPSGGKWIFAPVYNFTGPGGPRSSLTMDAAGNLYGTTWADGAYGNGSVFKLTASSGGWNYTSLHDFTGGSDGEAPPGGVVLDANGNLYGTTAYGGANGCGYSGCGVVWEITP